MNSLLNDLRFAWRVLLKSPKFTVVAILTLALGIGANTVIFTSINAMLLHPFSLKDSEGTVVVLETAPQQGAQHIKAAPANFRAWREQSKSFDFLAADHGWNVNLTGGGIAERVEGYRVTAEFFPLLGIAPQLGRSIAAHNFEPEHSSVVVLSHGFWQLHLGGNPRVVGSELRMNGQKFTVIGIMPAEFDFPVGAEAWAPLELSAAEQADRADHYLQVIGRLKSGVSRAQAQADLNTIANHLAQQYPQTNAGHGVRVVGLVEDLTTGSRQFVLVLMGASGFVLMLACANVANLLLARGMGRLKEIAVRLALGASRWKIARLLLVEGVLVALLGGLAGLLLASWGIELSRRSIPPFIVQHVAGIRHMQVDSRVLVFTIGVALLAGVLAGLMPALHVSHPDLNEALKESARGSSSSAGQHRLRALLVVTEVALALVLLVGAGLMVKGFGNLASADMGFDRRHVLTFHIALSEQEYRDQDRVRDFYDQVIQKLQALPRVDSAAVVTSLPAGWRWNWAEYSVDDRPPAAPGELRTTVQQSVTPDFFRVLRLPLLKGRFPAAQDGPSAPPVVVVSQSLARRMWRDEDPVGKHIKFGRPESNEPWRTIVGVVGDIRPSPFDPQPDPTTYFPFAQYPQASSALVVRTSGDPLNLAAAARTGVLSLDPDQPPYDVRTLEQLISDDISGVEFSARMMLANGIMALLLAAAGIFSVTTYSVTQRTHEIGVRVALGAQHVDVLGLVVGHALKLTMIGLAIGIPCALAVTYALSSLLFGVLRINTLIFVAFIVVLALTAALAAYLPARWAAKVDPMVALRYE